jgi:hypothetical protein
MSFPCERKNIYTQKSRKKNRRRKREKKQSPIRRLLNMEKGTMRIRLRHIWQRILRFLRLRPLSLAKKCQLTFGVAVVFTLALALLLPYIWMRKLTQKASLDAGRAEAQTLLFRRHFQLKDFSETTLVPLGNTGQVLDVNNPEIRWFRFKNQTGPANTPAANRATAKAAQIFKN